MSLMTIQEDLVVRAVLSVQKGGDDSEAWDEFLNCTFVYYVHPILKLSISFKSTDLHTYKFLSPAP
jgi:hypothetical protein